MWRTSWTPFGSTLMFSTSSITSVFADTSPGAVVTASADPPLDPDLLAGMTEWGRARLLRRLRFLELVEEGVEISEALRRARLNISTRSAQLLLRRVETEGMLALPDGRSFSRVEGRNPRTVRTPQVEALVRGLVAKGVSGVRPIQRAVAPVCAVLGLPAPSPSTIRRIVAARRSVALPHPTGGVVQGTSRLSPSDGDRGTDPLMSSPIHGGGPTR